MRRNIVALGLSLLALALLSWALMVQGPGVSPGFAAVSPSVEALPTPTPLPDEPLAAAYAEEQLLIELYERVSPSVVHIAVMTDGPGEGGTGSGFVLSVPRWCTSPS
jgi:hypothetical protein